MLTTTPSTSAGRNEAMDGLAPDAGVPNRRALLDADVVAASCSEGLGVDGPLPVRGCVLIRTKYRVGESLRVVYRVELEDGRSCVVAGRTMSAARATSLLAAADETTTDTGALRAMWHDRALGVLWWTFPHDHRLRGVGDLLRPDAELAALAGAGGSWTRSELVGLAPGRSAVLRACDDGGGTVGYAKVYAPGTTSVDGLAALYDAVAARLRSELPDAVSPAALGRDAQRDLLLLEAVTGSSWVGLSVDAAAVAMGRLGACMAVVHATPPPPGIELRRFTRLDARHLPRAAEVIATARPDAAASVDRLARQLLDSVPPMGRTGPPVLLHGDCHPGNLLSTPTQVALIDLDQAGIGPAAADIASLLARLRQGELTGEFGPGAADVLADAFLGGYAELRALPDPRVLAWHVASALLVERALRAVNRMNLRALDRLPELLNQASDMLNGTGRGTVLPNPGATR